MTQPSAALATQEDVVAPSEPAPCLRGCWLLLARGVWLLMLVGLLSNFIVGIPIYYAQLREVCSTLAKCSNSWQLLPDNVRALHHLGLSVDVYAAYFIVVDVAVSLVFLAVGALIFWRKSDAWQGLFVSSALVIFGCFGISDTFNVVAFGTFQFPLPLQVFLNVMGLVQWLFLPVFLLTFPTGRFGPRWSWMVVLLWVAQLVFFALPRPYSIFLWPPALFAAELLVVWGSTAAVQIYRYQRLYTTIHRQQTKWLVFGVAVGVLITVVPLALGSLVPGLNAPDSPYQLFNGLFTALLFLSIPLSVGIAILRYRLWDIDTIINKALVYGPLTALLTALYAGLIIGLESLAGLFAVQAAPNPLVLVISTLAIAALFLPLRRHLQTLIDRRFYRQKYDAEKTLTAFSATLRNEVNLQQIREHLIGVVRETMQPAHVSLWLRQPERRTEEQPHRLQALTQGLLLEQWEQSEHGESTPPDRAS